MFLTGIDVSYRTDGYATFPSSFSIQSVRNLKHTWSKEAMTDTFSAYFRGFAFFPESTQSPVTTITWSLPAKSPFISLLLDDIS